MMTMPDPEQVAKGLTKAQRDAVLGRRRLDRGPGMWPLRRSLHRLGLVEGLGANPTPLFYAVRYYLKDNQQ